MSAFLFMVCTATFAGETAVPQRESGFTNGLPMELVWVPNTIFIMGSSSNELDRAETEGPQTEVRISLGCWMGKYEVTRGQWVQLMGDKQSASDGDPRLPMEKVSWQEASEFCRRLTEREQAIGRVPTGYEYRLPTEAEWEHACRAGSGSRFSFADDLGYIELGDYAWFRGNSSNQVHIVGQKHPNSWDLYDMHGNVAEWCLDSMHPYQGEKLADPFSTNSPETRCVRGGTWNDPGKLLRAASRREESRDSHLNGVGFRVVLAGKIVPFASERDELAYAIGVIFGTGLRMEKYDLDPAIVAEAMKHAYSETNSLLMSSPRARAFLDVYRDNQRSRELKHTYGKQIVGTESTN